MIKSNYKNMGSKSRDSQPSPVQEREEEGLYKQGEPAWDSACRCTWLGLFVGTLEVGPGSNPGT